MSWNLLGVWSLFWNVNLEPEIRLKHHVLLVSSGMWVFQSFSLSWHFRMMSCSDSSRLFVVIINRHCREWNNGPFLLAEGRGHLASESRNSSAAHPLLTPLQYVQQLRRKPRLSSLLSLHRKPRKAQRQDDVLRREPLTGPHHPALALPLSSPGF